MKKVVIASNNPGKLRELGALLAPLGIEAIPQSELRISEAEEPHDTFLENALAKARHASRATGLPALADDSGLCVASLAGEPGVHSAHYAGREGSREERDARNNAKLVAALRDREDRAAFYYCVLVLVRSARGAFGGMMNLGPRPTFGDLDQSLEVHLFDASGDWYDSCVRVEFVRHMRNTVKFDSPEALVAQLRADERAARAALTQVQA